MGFRKILMNRLITGRTQEDEDQNRVNFEKKKFKSEFLTRKSKNMQIINKIFF